MARNTQMKHPETGDVKVVPDELVKQYEQRGWEKTAAKSSTSTASSKK